MPEDQDRANGANRPAEVIIAAVASAGKIETLLRFLSRLELPERAALAVILQNREALDEEAFRRGLGRNAGKLRPILDDRPIEPGILYLADVNVAVTVEAGRFRTHSALEQPGDRGTVDSFLVSLGRDEDGRAIAVVFAGTGGDGTLGINAVKETGGLTFAESTEDSPAELATSSHPAALADVVLPAEQLADRVASHAQHQIRQGEPGVSGLKEPDVESALRNIAAILRNRTGHDFHGYKRGTFLRRVQRRMQVAEFDDIESYIDYLRTSADEAQHLFNDLLIGVTQFFRDKKEFELLEREIVPKVFEGKTRADQLRVWVIGCSTGEEAYSIAILLREHMAKVDDAPQIQIFATDIEGRALAAARAGRYTDAVVKDVTPERLSRWFVKEGSTYCIAKELREMCIFSPHSIIKDAPFSRLDMISCRNLLIYLDADLQNQVIPLFHFALKPGGFLFLGNSENISRHTSLFAPVENRYRIFRRLETSTRILPNFAISAVDRRLADPPGPMPRPAGFEVSLARRAERIVERYVPAYVITDENFTVLHFSGRTGRFLEPAGGTASLNLLNLIHPDLRMDLRVALTRSLEENRQVHVKGLHVGTNGQPSSVEIVIEPVQDNTASPRTFVVVFKDNANGNGSEREKPGTPLREDERVQQLESELRNANERLQATVEELESTNEELKSANEEYQSLNEELQSANEELETSKEELQSVNEELTTVNGELAHRVQELGRANSDLKNLLESTQIATFFLDNDLKVMNFTPAAAEMFHVVETDIGRPISHIKPRIRYDELQNDVRRVLRSLGSVEREVDNPVTATRYMVRVLPYRTTDNFIGGAVVTFTDVTPVTRAQHALRESESRSRLLLAELQHRVRNTLAVIRSIVHRTAATSQSVQDYAMHIDGRLAAFARLQAALTRGPSTRVDLTSLVADELQSHAAREGEQVDGINGPRIFLMPKTAETLGLAIHELATNAVKYGALSTDRGHIRIDWDLETVDGEARLVFHWIESGMNLSGDPPTRRGFGMELLERTLAYDLSAETRLDFPRDGLHCTIIVPARSGLIASENPSVGNGASGND
jgi:two-component system CheB/CheR fusion protein